MKKKYTVARCTLPPHTINTGVEPDAASIVRNALIAAIAGEPDSITARQETLLPRTRPHTESKKQVSV